MEVGVQSLPAENDDLLTVSAIAALATIVASMLHEAVGHAAIALATGAKSGLLTAVAWSSESDSRLVSAGGTLINLAAAALFWAALRSFPRVSQQTRYFLLISMAFNLFDGTGYFFFSGVSNFGDWAAVIQGMNPHWVWRLVLLVFGIATYFAAVILVGQSFVRYLEIPKANGRRIQRLATIAYIVAIVVVGLAGLLNPISVRLVWLSALPATAGAHSGLLWFRHYILSSVPPDHESTVITRNYLWISMSAFLTLLYVLVIGRGVTLTA
jgi:hypothetical protein